MAEFKGINMTKIANTPSEKVNVNQSHGRIRVSFDTFEASSVPIGSTITMARLPSGSVVYDAIMAHDNLGASTVASVGDADNPSRLLMLANVSSKTVSSMSSQDSLTVDTVGYEYDKQTDVIITTSGGTINGTIKLIIYYVVD